MHHARLSARERTAVKESLASRRGDAARVLEGKRVGLFGAGSVGSALGLLLAQAGVGGFRVIDRDRLDASNLSRHACDLADLGRPKAEAVAELLERRLVQAEAVEVDLSTVGDAGVDRLLEGLDLAVASTDSPAAQFLVNEACIRTGIPGVFVGAYELACAGEVIVVRPGTGPCFFCAVGFRAELAPNLSVSERREAYQAAGADQLVAEPGLAADIAVVVAVAAAVSLAILDPEGSRKVLLDPSWAMLLVHGGSEPRGTFAELFRRPFDLVRARVIRPEPCPVCGWSSGEEGDRG
jgi:ThiF family protein